MQVSDIKSMLDNNSASKRFEIMMKGAKENGIDISYTPEVVFDTTTDTHEVWEQTMKTGIGSSSAGTFMGVNHYCDVTTAVMEKLGLIPRQPVTAEKQYMFDFGHAVEEPLLTFFKAKMGFEVYTDRNRYLHPKHRFMFTDPDGICIDNANMKCVVECKSCDLSVLKEWQTGVFGSTGYCPNESYIWQMVHHLSTMNLDRGYWVVGSSNSASNIKIVRFDRDFSLEKKLIETEGNVWNNYVAKGIVPDSKGISSETFDRLKGELKKRNGEEVTEEEVTFDESLRKNFEEYESVKESISYYNSQVKELKERQNSLELEVLKGLGNHQTGRMAIDDDYEYVVTNKAPKDRISVDTEKLSLEYPELYQKLMEEGFISSVKQKERFSFSKKKKFKKRK